MSRSLLIIPALALLGAAPPAAPGTGQAVTSPTRVFSPVPSICRDIASHAQGEQKGTVKRLGELPPGQTYMAVYRTDDKGCIDPMLASERQR